MPDPTQVLGALNLALRECSLDPVLSLDDDRTTDGKTSCVKFGGALLGGITPDDFDSKKDDSLDPTDQTRDGCFYHFNVQGNPSTCGNHTFCVYFLSGKVRIIQVFLGKTPKLIRSIARETFFGGLTRLRSGEPVQAYRELFGVEIADYRVDHIWTTRVNGWVD